MRISETVAPDTPTLRLVDHARAIELRYFSGLNESAETLGVSSVTLGRETRYAEAWLGGNCGRAELLC